MSQLGIEDHEIRVQEAEAAAMDALDGVDGGVIRLAFLRVTEPIVRDPYRTRALIAELEEGQTTFPQSESERRAERIAAAFLRYARALREQVEAVMVSRTAGVS